MDVNYDAKYDRLFRLRGTRWIDSEKDLFTLTESYRKLSLECPFLDDGVCQIYPARPFICRMYISHSIEECTGEKRPSIMDTPEMRKFSDEKWNTLRSISERFETELMNRVAGIPRGFKWGLLPRMIVYKNEEFFLALVKGVICRIG